MAGIAGAGTGGLAPPASTRISARIKCVKEHSSPVDVLVLVLLCYCCNRAETRIRLQAESCPSNLGMPRSWLWPENPGDMAWILVFLSHKPSTKRGTILSANLFLAWIPEIAYRNGTTHCAFCLTDVYRYCSPTRSSFLSGRLPYHDHQTNGGLLGGTLRM